MAVLSFEDLLLKINTYLVGGTETTRDQMNELQVDIVDTMEFNVTNVSTSFQGLATLSTNPGTPVIKVFYYAGTIGTYANFPDSGGTPITTTGYGFLIWNGMYWEFSALIVPYEGEIPVFDTVAHLPSPGTAGITYMVVQDPDDSINGYYSWNGSIYVLSKVLTDGEIAIGNNEAVSGDTVNRGLNNYPYVQNANPTGSSSKLTLQQCQEFVQDLYIEGTQQATKYYSIISVARNVGGLWLIRIGYSDLSGANIVNVSEFRATSSPEAGDKTTIHDLSQLVDDVYGKIAVNWEKIPDGTNATVMTYALDYGIDQKVWNKSISDGLVKDSKILVKDYYILRADPYLTSEEVDSIILNLYLENTDSAKRYGLFKLIADVSSQWSLQICEIDALNNILLIAQFVMTTSQTGVKYYELVEANNSGVTGNCVINWDELTTGINYAFGTASRFEGYLLNESNYKNLANDLEARNQNYDTLYDAYQDGATGIINVGIMPFKSLVVHADSRDDYLSVTDKTKVSDLYGYSYIDTQNARLMLIDENDIMWWRDGTTIYQCTVDVFKANLSSITPTAGFSGETWYQFDKAVLTLVQAINVFAMREGEGRIVAQSNITSDLVGTYYYYDEGTAQFIAATVPTGGRQGEMRSAWGFEMHNNIVITSGYNLAYAAGRLLYSNDYGESFNAILDIATTGILTSAERAIAHIHGCFIDRYNDNRIYVLLGDYSHIPAGTGKVFYCDNPEDVTPTWVKMEIDATENPDGNEQYVAGYGLPRSVLFGTDMNANGIYRMARVNKTHVKREYVVEAIAYSGSIQYIPGSFYKRDKDSPLVLFNQSGDIGGVPGNIYATMDGINFYKIWEDVVNHDPFYNIQTPVITRGKDELYCMFQGGAGTKDRFLAQTLLFGKFKVD